MTTVYVCPERDIECGRNQKSWCATCPQRATTTQPRVSEQAEDLIARYVPGRWFDARTLDEMQDFYLSRLPAIREAAREHGYAIGLHGSARRDFDLMAMQWRDDASDKDTLAHAIAVAACGITREGAYQWEQKPNGRFAVSMPICCTDHTNPDVNKPSSGHIDLSVIDSRATQQAAPEAPMCGACGKVWDGEPCGQQDNGWPHPVCYPAGAPNRKFSADGSLSIAEAVSGVLDLFPGADKQALQCLAELMGKPAPVAAPEAPTLQNWLNIIHDNELALGDRLQRISSGIRSIMAGDAPDKYPPHAIREQCACRDAPEAPTTPELTVWYGPMPESNGKSNFTAILTRKDATGFDVFDGFTIARSEYPDRVRYEADCVRHLVGELPEKPCILDYDANKHSGYAKPAATTASASGEAQHVECRECSACGHVGINDASDTMAACHNCDWSGPTPTEDHCPGCAATNCMGAACPKCGGIYKLLAETELPDRDPAPSREAAPQAAAGPDDSDEPPKQKAGETWHIRHKGGATLATVNITEATESTVCIRDIGRPHCTASRYQWSDLLFIEQVGGEPAGEKGQA